MYKNSCWFDPFVVEKVGLKVALSGQVTAECILCSSIYTLP